MSDDHATLQSRLLANPAASVVIHDGANDSGEMNFPSATSPVSPTWGEVLNPSKPVPKGTAKAAVFTLVSTIIGGGVLSLPFTFAACGLGVGILLTVIMAWLSAYSGVLLFESAKNSGGESYEDVALRTIGPRASTLVSVLVLLLVYMASIGYIVLFGDLTTHIFPPLLDCSCKTGMLNKDVRSCEERNRWLYMAISSGIIYPVTLLRNLSALRITSFLSVLSIGFLAGALSYKSTNDNENPQIQSFQSVVDPCVGRLNYTDPHVSRLGCIVWYRFEWELILSIPILACSFMCHFNVLPIHKELTKPTRKRMWRIIYSTMGLALFLYCIVGVAGYLDFFSVLLSKTGGNILNLYSPHDRIINAGRVGLLGTILLSFPLLTHPARSIIEKLVLNKFSTASGCRNFVTTTLILVSSYLIACVVPSIVVVWSVTGSLVAIIVAYVLPPVFYLRTLDDVAPDERCSGRRCRALSLAIFGTLLSILCTTASVFNIITSKETGGPPPNFPCNYTNPVAPNNTVGIVGETHILGTFYP